MASMPSRSSASANFLSLLTRACTRSANSLVFAIVCFRSALPALALFVIAPIALGRINDPLLPLLRSARQQDHDLVAVPPKLDAVASSDIAPVFQPALSNDLNMGAITLLHSGL